MSYPSSKLEKCPPRKELSAFCDDCPEMETTAPHVARCPECTETVGDYRRIGQMITDSVVEPLDLDALNARICASVRLEQARPPRFSFLPGRLHKVAAVLVVGALTGVVGVGIGQRIWPGGEDALKGREISGVAIAPVDDAKTAALPDLPYYTGLNLGLRHANSIPIQSLAAANYGDNNAPVFEAVKGLAQPQVHVDISRQVKQVWVMPGSGFSVTDLQDYLNSRQIVNNSLRQSPNGTWVLSAVLDKEQLIQLVRFLDSQHFDLLSPSAPQPEQKYFIGRPTDMVGYTAEFVEN
jgi:hypothetical protein